MSNTENANIATDSVVTLQKGYNLISDKLSQWLFYAIEHLPNFIVAVIAFFFFFLLARLVSKVIYNLCKRAFNSEQISNLLMSISKVATIFIGLFVALEIIGLSGTVTSLLAGAGIAGLALGFAFQDMTENFIAGVAMGIRKPFTLGDVIQCQDVFGTVREINLRNTIIETFYGQFEIVPNKILFRNMLTNYYSTNERKIEIQVGIPYSQDIQQAADIISNAINKHDFVIKKNETITFCEAFGDSSINLKVWFWIAYPHETDFIRAQHQGMVTVKRALDNAGISIPFPIRTLDIPKQSDKNTPLFSDSKVQ